MIAKAMAVLAIIGLVDSISYMAVSPSLIFYVQQSGGTLQQYGFIMSTFSFASFVAKPLYGLWVDKISHQKFRVPYLASLSLSVLGGFLYFSAVALVSSSAEDQQSEGLSDGVLNKAVAMIFTGRLLSGLGAGNQALGFAYIAAVVPPESQTKTSTLLSMMRIFGMAVGPAVNYFLGEVESEFLGIPLDPLNSVGLLLAFGNLCTMLVVYLFLPEPHPDHHDHRKLLDQTVAEDAIVASSPESSPDYWKSILSIDILLPCFILFTINSCFQLIETALPPTAYHSLDWGPVQTSGVLGSTSLVIFLSMTTVMWLSSQHVSDIILVFIGNTVWVVGGTLIYYFWTSEASPAGYVIPVVIAVSGFPFVASPNRSNFTKAVRKKPALEESQATMQAILSMTASIAGFCTPGFVATFVIRSPEQVEAAKDGRELTPLALYAPILCLFNLLGLFYSSHWDEDGTEHYSHPHEPVVENDANMEPSPSNEKTPLVQGRRSSVAELRQSFSRDHEVSHRSSVAIMGLVCHDTKHEHSHRQSQRMELKELQKDI